MAAEHDFVILQNSDFARDLEWKDTTDQTIDLTGYTAEMDIRYGYRGGRLAAQLDTETGGIIIENDLIKLRMSAEETLKLKPQACYYDLLLRKDLSTLRLMEGRVIISQGVTK